MTEIDNGLYDKTRLREITLIISTVHSTSGDKPSAQSIHNITRIITPECNTFL
jgi:hypothetical protein